ncbi:MAG TPA: response regulator [Sphingomicrobium sp.]|jgi:FixJ family two-component response regulator|nr:response regulator [Sphingomicrobium sp.]
MQPLDSAAERRKRILLVEDDAAVRRSLQLALAGDGYDVRAYGGSTGLTKDAEALQASCLVADLILDEAHAIDLLDDLRAAGWSGPAILISGHLDDQWRSQALRAGFDAVLEKPVSGVPLLKEIHRLIGTP